MKGFGKPTFWPRDLFYVFFLGLVGVMLWEAWEWNFSAKLVPMIVGSLALLFAGLSLIFQIFRRPELQQRVDGGDEASKKVNQARIHMDLTSDLSKLTRAQVYVPRGFVPGLAAVPDAVHVSDRPDPHDTAVRHRLHVF